MENDYVTWKPRIFKKLFLQSINANEELKLKKFVLLFSLWSCIVHYYYVKKVFLIHVIRKQVFLQIYCRGIGTFLFIVLIRYCWKLLKICILELMMHKCGTEKQTEGTKTENLMDTVWIYKARKIKAFKILVQFRLWCWLTHGGVSMSPRCEKSAEAYGTFCRVLNQKNRKCTKKSLNVVQIHASPYENFSKCLLNFSANIWTPVKAAKVWFKFSKEHMQAAQV